MFWHLPFPKCPKYFTFVPFWKSAKKLKTKSRSSLIQQPAPKKIQNATNETKLHDASNHPQNGKRCAQWNQHGKVVRSRLHPPEHSAKACAEECANVWHKRTNCHVFVYKPNTRPIQDYEEYRRIITRRTSRKLDAIRIHGFVDQWARDEDLTPSEYKMYVSHVNTFTKRLVKYRMTTASNTKYMYRLVFKKRPKLPEKMKNTKTKQNPLFYLGFEHFFKSAKDKNWTWFPFEVWRCTTPSLT